MEAAIITAVDSLLSYARARQAEMAAQIRQFVECESPSDDPSAVNRFVELVSDTVTALGQLLAGL
jgi:glutamate carboxypeptidase